MCTEKSTTTLQMGLDEENEIACKRASEREERESKKHINICNIVIKVRKSCEQNHNVETL